MTPLLVVALWGAFSGPVQGVAPLAFVADTGAAIPAPPAPCPVPGGGDEAGSTPLPSPADVWVQGAVARAWDVEAGCVVVEWPVGAPEAFAGEASLEGSGAAGLWTVAFPLEGRTRRIPVRTSTRVLMPVAVRSLSRGAVVDPSDIRWEPGVQAGPVGREAPEEIAGWTVARPLAPGDALTPPAIRPPVAVKVGEVVQVTWNGTTVQARREGTALRTGAIGDTVDVRLGQGTRRRARITGSGMVELIRPGTPGRNDR
jgi:flagella basal body P-ring formation protein FlgA